MAKDKAKTSDLSAGIEFLSAYAQMYDDRCKGKKGKQATAHRALAKSLHACADKLEDA